MNGHYKALSYEPLELSAPFYFNPVEHSFLKYVSRCYYKNKEQDIDKAIWFLEGETSNGVKNKNYIRDWGDNRAFLSELGYYCSVNNLESWQTISLKSFFTRKFDECEKQLKKGKLEIVHKFASNNSDS